MQEGSELNEYERWERYGPITTSWVNCKGEGACRCWVTEAGKVATKVKARGS